MPRAPGEDQHLGELRQLAWEEGWIWDPPIGSRPAQTLPTQVVFEPRGLVSLSARALRVQRGGEKE